MSRNNSTLSSRSHCLNIPVEVSNKALFNQRLKSNSISTPRSCNCENLKAVPTENNTATDWHVPSEKSSMILVAIVLLFVVTHSYRLALKVYEVVIPQGNTFENFKRCFAVGR